MKHVLLIISCVCSLSVMAQVNDLCKGTVDPYDAAAARVAFLKAAGVDNELSADEFAADQKAGGTFTAQFDKWENLAAFDKDGNKTIDWFEFDAYRQDIRDRMLAAFDANGDGKLTAKERDDANAALAKGVIPAKKAGPKVGAPPAAPPADPPDAPGFDPVPRTEPDIPQANKDAIKKYQDFLKNYEEFYNKFDADGDGTLSVDEDKKAAKAYMDETEKLTKAAFDLNGDGKVTSEESNKAQQWMMWEYHRQALEKYDTNRNGKLDDDERKAMFDDMTKQFKDAAKKRQLAKYDANKNGVLDPEEEKKIKDDQAAQAKQFEKMQRDAIKRWDKDGDGKLNDDERAEMQADMQVDGRLSWEHGKGLDIKRWDTDNDGKLSEAELKVRREKTLQAIKDQTTAFRKKMLEQYDTDRDGKLSDDEKKVMNEKIARKVQDNYKQMCKEADKDGDGVVSSDEWSVYSEAQRKRILEKYDKDKDGELSPEENQEMLQEEYGHTGWGGL